MNVHYFDQISISRWTTAYLEDTFELFQPIGFLDLVTGDAKQSLEPVIFLS